MRGFLLTTHIQFVLRLNISRAMHPRPLYALRFLSYILISPFQTLITYVVLNKIVYEFYFFFKSYCRLHIPSFIEIIPLVL